MSLLSLLNTSSLNKSIELKRNLTELKIFGACSHLRPCEIEWN